MFKALALLSPLFVTIFWTFLLNSQRGMHSPPRSFLSKLMFLFVILNLARFSQRAPLPELYVCIDILYIFVGTISYPLYHIYFRLLTIDKKFTLRIHYKYLVLPLFIGVVYLFTVLSTPHYVYSHWLFDRESYQDMVQIKLLKVLRLVILVVIDLQAIYYLLGNINLLKRYGNRAEQHYSNIIDGKYNNGKILNFLIIFNCLIHVVNALNIIQWPNPLILYSVLYAIDYYLIGYMGFKQKMINPTYESNEDAIPEEKITTDLNPEQKRIKAKIQFEFEKNKIYLNSELTILDVVQIVGKNRTYISSIINQEFNNNFCAFVNNFRIAELEKVINENPLDLYDVLAEKTGFGSVKSMKRAVYAKTGLTFQEWKKINSKEN